MKIMNNQESFEREKKFHQILKMALKDCPELKASTIKKIIAEINPGFMDGLFAPRPYVKNLRYVGCRNEEQPCPNDDDFFEVGKTYQSIDFTGATYRIAGYGEKRIGASYFDEID
jgi:hypothetical protein